MIREFRPGKILNDAVGLYFRGFGVLFPITLLCYLPTIVISLLYAGQTAGQSIEEQVENIRNGNTMRQGLILQLVGIIAQALATGALSYTVYQLLRGKPVSIGDGLSIGFKRLLPLVGVAICSGLFVGLGLLLLIVPGIIFATMVYVASPACVVEGMGVFAAMQRSRELTNGFRWKIVVLWVIAILAAAGVGAIVGVATVGIPSAVGKTALLSLMQVVVAGVFCTASVIAYYHMRSIKESVDIENVASAFD